MGPIENLQRQHYEILMLAQQILGLIANGQIAQSAAHIRSLLSTLTGKLKMHLAIEDNVLYPKLKSHTSQRVRETAAEFAVEMGGLKEAFSQYSTKWLLPQAIAAVPQEFATETNSVFSLLKERIKREEQSLYPLF